LNTGVKEGYPLKVLFFLLLALIVQVGTDLLHIIIRTSDGLFRFVNVDDLE